MTTSTVCRLFKSGCISCIRKTGLYGSLMLATDNATNASAFLITWSLHMLTILF